MAKGQGVELEQRLKVCGVSLLGGVVSIAIMSIIFDHPDSGAGAFLLDRHTENFPYPFTIQNVMWLMFWIGCGELWVRFNQAKLEMEQMSKRYLPEDDEVMLRARDLGSFYQKVKPMAEEQTFLFTAPDYALYSTISGEPLREPSQLAIEFFPRIISARARTQIRDVALSRLADTNVGVYRHCGGHCVCVGLCGQH